MAKNQPRFHVVIRKIPGTNKQYNEVIVKNDPCKHALLMLRTLGEKLAARVIEDYASNGDIFWKNANGFLKNHMKRKAAEKRSKK